MKKLEKITQKRIHKILTEYSFKYVKDLKIGEINPQGDLVITFKFKVAPKAPWTKYIISERLGGHSYEWDIICEIKDELVIDNFIKACKEDLNA